MSKPGTSVLATNPHTSNPAIVECDQELQRAREGLALLRKLRGQDEK